MKANNTTILPKHSFLLQKISCVEKVWICTHWCDCTCSNQVWILNCMDCVCKQGRTTFIWEWYEKHYIMHILQEAKKSLLKSLDAYQAAFSLGKKKEPWATGPGRISASRLTIFGAKKSNPEILSWNFWGQHPNRRKHHWVTKWSEVWVGIHQLC